MDAFVPNEVMDARQAACEQTPHELVGDALSLLADWVASGGKGTADLDHAILALNAARDEVLAVSAPQAAAESDVWRCECGAAADMAEFRCAECGALLVPF